MHKLRSSSTVSHKCANARVAPANVHVHAHYHAYAYLERSVDHRRLGGRGGALEARKSYIHQVKSEREIKGDRGVRPACTRFISICGIYVRVLELC